MFPQRMVLHHRDAGAPMVLYSSGADLHADYLSELTETLGANQLSTEHRFFGASIVEDLFPEEWIFATVRQAAFRSQPHRDGPAPILRRLVDQHWARQGRRDRGPPPTIFSRRRGRHGRLRDADQLRGAR
jgi:hypothetical protein